METFCSDPKSRGCPLHQWHLSDPQRLSRLLIAACRAYIWIIYLGALWVKEPWVTPIHRTDRYDLGWFQLGLRLLAHVLNEGLSIPVVLHLPIEEPKSVR